MKIQVAIVLLLASCSSLAGEDTECEQDEQTGVYVVTFTERSGNCGAKPTMTIPLRLEQAWDGDGRECMLSNGNDGVTSSCHDEGREFSCPPGETITFDIEVAPDGASFEGTAKVKIDGDAPCASLYAVSGRG